MQTYDKYFSNPVLVLSIYHIFITKTTAKSLYERNSRINAILENCKYENKVIQKFIKTISETAKKPNLDFRQNFAQQITSGKECLL